MSGLFGTFNIAKSGMNAQQAELNVTSHNIANANTPGYTRQVATITTTAAQNTIGSAGQIGTGVQVASIARVKDDFLDYQIRNQNSALGTYTAQDQVLSQVQNVINESSDSSIGALTDDFYNSFHQLALTPSDSAAKQLVVAKSLALTDSLNSTYTQLKNIKAGTEQSIGQAVTDVNNLVSQISDLNKSITQITLSGQKPNDLLDTRDNLVDQLSSYLGINVTSQRNNGISIATSDTPPVSLSGSDGSVHAITLENDVDNIKTGTIAGYTSAKADVVTNMNKLDNFARGLAYSVNAIETQSSSSEADGTATRAKDDSGLAYNIFVNSVTASDENGINAGNITINTIIKDDSNKIVTGVSNDPNISGKDDGSRALAIAQLQTTHMNIDSITTDTTRATFLTGTPGSLFSKDSTLGVSTVKNSSTGATTDNYFTDMVDTIGIKEQKAIAMMKNQSTVLASFATTKASVSGVSLDEEMANLVQFQHAYQANAKMISTIDSLLDVVINGLKK